MSDQARATIEIGATTAQLAAGLRRGTGMINTFARGAASVMKRIGGAKIGGGSMGGILAGAAGGFAMGMAGRGIDMMVNQAEAVMDFERNLTRLGIAGNMSAAKLDALRTSARGVSSAVGIGADQILAGTQTYVDLTGDIDGASASMSTFARVAQASGASVADVAAAAAGFKGIGVPLENMEATFSGLITQGKAGAVSLKDFAGEIAKLAPRWAKFKDSTNPEGIAQLGAAFQIARQGFGSASEAATGMQALMGAMVQNAKKFDAAGVKIFDRNPKTGVKTMRSFEEIMRSIEKSKLVKDPTLMTKALGSKEAEQTMTMLMRARGEITATGNAYTDLVASGKDAGAVQKDLATYLESSAGKMDVALTTAKNKLAEVFTPERINKFVEALGVAVDLFGKMVGYIDRAGTWIASQTKEGQSRQIVAERDKRARATNNPEIMYTASQKLMEAYARHQHEGHSGGAAGRRRDAFDEAAMPAAIKLRQDAEEMIRAKNPWDPRVMKSKVAGDLGAKSDVEKDALAKKIGQSIVDALKASGDKLVPDLHIGDNQVSKSQKKATDRRTRP